MSQPTEVKIDCPEHPGQHEATLHCHDSEFAGIWECNETGEGISDTHDHEGEEILSEEVDTNYGPDDDGTTTVHFYALCGMRLEA